MSDFLLQFGAGNFLRAFVDLFVQEMNEAGRRPLHIVVVQSTDGERARLLNEQKGRYHVVVRGIESGVTIDRIQECASISQALIAQTEWPKVVEATTAPGLKAIISNTTEAGFVLEDADREAPAKDTASVSFPARLLMLLKARYAAGQPGVVLLPCELLDENALRLRELVLEQANRWRWDGDARFMTWLSDECQWVNNLVDRIVSGMPAEHPLKASDPLLTVAEPFQFWAVEDKPGTEFLNHPTIHRVPDVRPFGLRKVRILNGAHTAMLAYCRKYRPDIQLVREAVADPTIREWLNGLLFEEIVPTIRDRVPDAEGFAHQTIERFANPFLDHKLSAIALHHDKKVPVRLVPTRDEFVAKFGCIPERLQEAILTPV
jgi:tagaturonate reductase